jgi:hypothetical protein
VGTSDLVRFFGERSSPCSAARGLMCPPRIGSEKVILTVLLKSRNGIARNVHDRADYRPQRVPSSHKTRD